MNCKDIETREKIVEISIGLFATNGYKGTSVREIAKQADVNIASVNYYFGSKSNLYLESIKRGHKEIYSKIKEVTSCDLNDPIDYCIHVFDALMEKQTLIVNNMKLVLSSESSEIDGVKQYFLDKDTYGAPGSDEFIHLVNKKLGYQISDCDSIWIAQAVFSVIFHSIVISATPYKESPKLERFLAVEPLRMNLKRTAKTLIESLKGKAE